MEKGAVEVGWTTVFVDLAADVFDLGVDFWCEATSSTLSDRRGTTDQFATLLPPDGDPYVRVQRTADGTTGIHLDLHVSDPAAASDRACEVGASVVADHGYRIMKSPGGFVFCFVQHHGESVVPAAADVPPHRLDQLCIDVPPTDFETEGEFWSALTGWEMRQSALPEFRPLERPANVPLRLLLQRLDDAPQSGRTHAHLDIACGDAIDQVAERHIALGAKTLGRTKVWMQMRDPAGMRYCLTPRQP